MCNTTAWLETALLIYWKTRWRGNYGPVVVQNGKESSHWRGVRRAIMDKVSDGEALSLHEDALLLADLAAEEVKGVTKALKAGRTLREAAYLVESPAGLRALCSDGRLEWMGASRIITESGLKGRGWDLFYHSGYWQSREGGEKVFPGCQTADEVIVQADREVAVLTPGDDQNPSLLVVYPKA